MLQKLWIVFRIPELRQKIVLTLILLAVYRLGYHIFLPIIDQETLAQSIQSQENNAIGRAMQVLQMFSASSVGMATIFGLGIMPYISASIVFQLLGSVYPPLEKLQKEGEAGRKKINEYTRYATVILAFGQSLMWIRSTNAIFSGASIVIPDFSGSFYLLSAALTMTAGTVL
ncbi:MAG: preprotein translocase subunit SecY, partial [Planctomycetaceae bacterium]|nr:preprotein translocase subunit SecY [Planctomycetaceae bacterium]